jgi:hypothetical protein
MARKTRAAAKAEAVLTDSTSTATEPVEAINRLEREPLRSITPNSVHSEDPDQGKEEQMQVKKSGGKKKGKGGKRGKKANADQTTEAMANVEEEENEDNEDFGASVNSQVPVEGPARDEAEGSFTPPDGITSSHPEQQDGCFGHVLTPRIATSESPVRDRPASPDVNPLRRSRRNKPKETEEVRSEEEPIPEAPHDEIEAEEEELSSEDARDRAKSDLSVHAPPPYEEIQQATPVIKTPEPIEEHKDPLTDLPTPPESSADLTEASQVGTPSARSHPMLSPATSARSPHPEDPIEAMDALEDELDAVTKILPPLDDSPHSPLKPPPVDQRSPSVKSATTKEEKRKSVKLTPSAVKSSGSKTAARDSPSTRRGLTGKLANTTQPSATSKTLSQRQSTRPAPAPAPTTSTFPRSTAPKPRPSSMFIPKHAPAAKKPRPSSMVVPKDGATAAGDKPVDYLTAKRRPISLHFPTPPPPPKSSKPPTKPSFTLPGEAIAAKLKAAREERQKKEEEELQKRRESRARPAPGLVRSTSVKQTPTSRPRIAAMRGGDKENAAANAASKPLNRSSTVTGVTSTSTKRSSVFGKRELERKAAGNLRPGESSSSISQKRSSVIGAHTSTATAPTRSSSLTVPKRQPSVRATSNPLKRISSTTSTLTNVSRVTSTSSQPGGPVAKSTVTAQDISVQQRKGKEIFNRDRVEKEARERERREKEDKARKAREEAAERSRLLSREFRERQRRKLEAAERTKREGAPVAV